MPDKDSGAKVNVVDRLGALIIFFIMVFVILWYANRNLSGDEPPPFVVPTSTFPVPDPGIMAVGCPDVKVTAKEANPFDEFDVNEVVIRVSNSSVTDDGADGRFSVCSCPEGEKIFAWAPSHAIESVPCDGKTTYHIELTHLDAVDDSLYSWASAVNNCNACHGNQYRPDPEGGATFDEVNEWFSSGHAKVLTGGYFETMYLGTSATGQTSIPAQPVIIDNEWVPVPAEISYLYHGPGFQLDFPMQPGNCAHCHVPTAVQASQNGVDLAHLFQHRTELGLEGVTCDVCHKAFEVILADDGNPFPERPGILSYRFLRPTSGELVTGPFTNLLTWPLDGLNRTVDHRSVCTPLFSRSEFCAPCHFGKFGDMVIYNSYGEWRASPYARDPASPGYRTCQDCHMSHMDVDDTSSLWSQRQACSAGNVDFRDFNHNMMNFGYHKDEWNGTEGNIPRMVKGAARIDVSFGSETPGPDTLDVNVSVTNIKAGHKFPTDSPLRHLILVVSAVDRVGTPLIQVGGDRIPNWAGPGPISPLGIAGTLDSLGIKDYGGQPGRVFANLLVEEETNLSPGMAYWNETRHASVDATNDTTSDTRLVPRVPDRSRYSFAMPDEGKVTVAVQLIYRYAFYDLVVWKEWFNRPDIVVTQVMCQGRPAEPAAMDCRQVEPPAPAPTPTATP